MTAKRELPSGTVTFLFSDIEGSTRLLEELGRGRYAAELQRHRSAVRQDVLFALQDPPTVPLGVWTL